MKKNLGIGLVALLVVGMLASTGWTQWNYHWEKTEGVIGKVDPTKKEIVLQTQKGEMALSTDQHTVLSKWANKISWKELKKGAPVTVEYMKDGEKMVATWVDIGAQ